MYHTVRIVIGLLFVVSGGLKLADPVGFADSIRSFRLVGDPLVAGLALAVPWFEVVVGLCVVIGVWTRTAITFHLGALVFFTAVIILSWMRGLDITCGCFGGSGATNYPVKLLQNFVMLAAAAWVWWETWKRTENGNRSVWKTPTESSSS